MKKEYRIWELHEIFNSSSNKFRNEEFIYAVDELIYYLNNKIIELEENFINLQEIIKKEHSIEENAHPLTIKMDKCQKFPRYDCSRTESTAHMELKLIGSTYLNKYYNVNLEDLFYESKIHGRKPDIYSEGDRIWGECGSTGISNLFTSLKTNHTFFIFPFLKKRMRVNSKEFKYPIYKFTAKKELVYPPRIEEIKLVPKLFDKLFEEDENH